MKTINSIQIENKDIAIIERLHDMLLCEYDVPFSHPLLKESRELSQGLIKAMEGRN
jgi:hypothetical protein|tara:strand:- start:509 stop:676 length:168 start_codon:yes stop_codon:yes gene_type:complete